LDAMKLANDAYKTSLDAAKAEIHRLIKERDNLRDHIHTCCPTCMKAGCVNRRLRDAAQAVVDRWETPLWKDAAPTADVIYKLRAALGEKS